MKNTNLFFAYQLQVDEEYDSITKMGDEKCFYSLNLNIPMKYPQDKKNITKPHLIFRASSFQTAEQQHNQKEASNWDK